MLKNILITFALVVILQNSTKAQTENLFNGKDLTGWNVYGTEKWYVEKGLLVCESGPDKEYGYLGTDKEYKNFQLELEFKQGADGNSGVFFRSSIDGTKITGWQVVREELSRRWQELNRRKCNSLGGL